MLSGESAVGAYPVETVATMARIAQAAETGAREREVVRECLEQAHLGGDISSEDLISLSINAFMSRLVPRAVISPARTGLTTRRLARFRLPTWVISVSDDPGILQGLNFCYGVYPVHEPLPAGDWETWARRWLRQHGIDSGRAVLTHRLSSGTNRMEFIELSTAEGG